MFKNKTGFTLIETIIAVFILVFAVLVIYEVFSGMAMQAGNQPNNLIAAYLAQEGIETIKNMRDSNWVKSQNRYWLEGIIEEGSPDCINGCFFEADYKTGLDGQQLFPFTDGRFLNIDSNGIYSYDAVGEYSPTIFKRKITVTGPINDDTLRVFALVFWNYRGAENSVLLEEYIYNWY